MISFNFLILTFIEMSVSIPLFLGQSLVNININSPIGRLLVLISQSFTFFTNLSEPEKLIGIMI